MYLCIFAYLELCGIIVAGVVAEGEFGETRVVDENFATTDNERE